jgi:hypothetical protein
MKKHLYLIVVLFVSGAGFSQTGVIYNIAFRIDPELITETKVQNKDHQILNISTIEEMPKSLSDTIAYLSEQAIGLGLGTSLSSMVPEEKFIMAAIPEHLMYLPANTLNKAVKTAEHQYYVNISCHVAASGGTTITLGKERFTKVKPKVTLIVKAFDKDKEKIHEKEVVLKDFEKLRSHTFEHTYGVEGVLVNTDEVTNFETLNSDDILRMYLMALEQAY